MVTTNRVPMTTKSRSDLTDSDTIFRAQKQMQTAAKALAEMSESIADARQIKEYDSDRRKRALADVVSVLLDSGESAAAAEFKARASKSYGDALIQLGVQYREAMRAIEKAEAQRVLFEAARSLLSCEKAKMGLL